MGSSSFSVLIMKKEAPSVADPGFPRCVGVNPPKEGGGGNRGFWQISQKLHGIERIWMSGEGGVVRPFGTNA